jgi:hypothetical protein
MKKSLISYLDYTIGSLGRYNSAYDHEYMRYLIRAKLLYAAGCPELISSAPKYTYDGYL